MQYLLDHRDEITAIQLATEAKEGCPVSKVLKGASIMGVFWGDFVRREPEASAANARQLLAWLREGALRPLVSRRYPLSQAPAALEALLAREAVGKLVVLPQLAG